MMRRPRWRRITQLLAITLVLAGLAIPVISAAAPQARSAGAVRHCGSYKFGIDGLQPGPSAITAKNVSCWFARATALLGAAPGWHCRLAAGVSFVCKPKHGKGRVNFFGE